MKPWWAALALLPALLCAGSRTASAQAAPVQIVVNDTAVSLPAPAEAGDGVVVAPIAPIVQAFGGTTQWDAAAHALVLRGVSGTTLRLVVGQTAVTQGDAQWDLPVAPVLQDGVVVAPVARVLRGLGAYVEQHDDGTLDVVSQVTGLDWHGDAAGLAVTVSSTGPVRATGSVLHAPDRLVIDLQSAVIRLNPPQASIGLGAVIGMRAAQFHVRPYVTRLVFDLARPLPFRVTASPGAVTLALGAGSPAAGSSASTPPASGAGGGGAATAAASGAASTPSGQAPGASTGAHAAGNGPQAAGSVPSAAGSGPPGAAAGSAPPGRESPGSTPAPPRSEPTSAATGAKGGSDASVADSGSGQVSTAEASGEPEPVALPPLPEFTDGPGAFHVQSVTYDGATGRLLIQASQRVAFEVHQWTYPDRIAIDIANGVFRDRRADIEIDSGGIRNVVVSQFTLRPNMTRVLVRLNQKVAYTVAAADGGRTLTVAFAGAGRRGPVVPAVIIDPGHGGDDPGAIGPHGTHEADVVLGIGSMVRDALEGQGIRVVMTRTTNTSVALEDRPDLAQRYGGVLFVSIHANASSDSSVQGTTTYYYTPQSRPLAELVQTEVTHALGEPDRGLQTARFYVIVNAQMPAILIETAFISNPKEEAMLCDPAVQRRIADAIARGIEKFLAEQSQPTAH